MMSHTRILIGTLVLSLSTVALAQQDGTFPPGGPGGQDAPRQGGRGGDPAQLVERMMQMDANGDGKLTKDEAQGPFADRAFDRVDANKDGFVDRAELENFAKSGGMRGLGGQRGQGGQGGGAPGGAVNVEGAMKQINGAYKALNASAFDTASRSADLEAVQRLQMAIFGAKGGAGSLRMSDAAKAKFGEDKAAFEAAYRRAMLESAKIAVELELAILDGKSGEAKALVAKLHKTEETGHELFKMEEGGAEERPAGGREGRARRERPAGES
jgi:hypothetical protein